jgi:hypothetical protein
MQAFHYLATIGFKRATIVMQENACDFADQGIGQNRGKFTVDKRILALSCNFPVFLTICTRDLGERLRGKIREAENQP